MKLCEMVNIDMSCSTSKEVTPVSESGVAGIPDVRKEWEVGGAGGTERIDECVCVCVCVCCMCMVCMFGFLLCVVCVCLYFFVVCCVLVWCVYVCIFCCCVCCVFV